MVHGRPVLAIVKPFEENCVGVVEFKRSAVFEGEF
jgi:hypothetical protein